NSCCFVRHSIHFYFLRFLLSYRPPRPLHSFPTRRSSDLRHRAVAPTRRSRTSASRPRQPPFGCGRRASAEIRVPGTGISALARRDRKSTRLNYSHVANSYAVLRLKKKTAKRPKALPL